MFCRSVLPDDDDDDADNDAVVVVENRPWQKVVGLLVGIFSWMNVFLGKVDDRTGTMHDRDFF